MRKPRIALPVICAHFRYEVTKYGCEKHGECVHTVDFKQCSDYKPVRRAGAQKPKMTINEVIEARKRCRDKKVMGLPCEEFK